MNLRHAVAIGLVGWYLLEPQPLPNGSLDIKAPLSQWNQTGAFDSAAACTRERDHRFKLADKAKGEAEQELDRFKGSPTDALPPKVSEDVRTVTSFSLSLAASRCIATDDPRLKGN